MVATMNITARSAASQAAVAASGANGPGASRPGTFDGVLSAKNAEHGNSTTAAPVDHAAAPTATPRTVAQKQQHSSAGQESGNPNSSAIAVPAQVSAPSQTNSSKFGNADADPSSKTSATTHAALDAVASNGFTAIAASTLSGAAAQSAKAILTGDTAPAVLSGDSSSKPASQASTPANSAKDEDTEPESAGAVTSPPSVDELLDAASANVSSAMPTEKTAAQADTLTGAGKPATIAANTPPGQTGIAVSARTFSSAAVQQPQQTQDDTRKSLAATEVDAATSSAEQLKLIPVPPAVAVESSNAGAAATSRGISPASAAASAREVSVSATPAQANHSGADTQSGDQKDSNADSAAVAKAAGLTQAPVAAPQHASGDAPAPAPAGPATADPTPSAVAPAAPANAGASASIDARPVPLPAAAPSSLNDSVQASQLYQHVGGAEMHIAMNTDLLGAVDVHAVLRQSTVSATIGVQRADVQSLLSNDLPALQHALAERSLHVEQISVLGGSTGSQTDSGRQSAPNQQSWRGPNTTSQSAGYGGGSIALPGFSAAGSEAPAATYSAGRLSVHV